MKVLIDYEKQVTRPNHKYMYLYVTFSAVKEYKCSFNCVNGHFHAYMYNACKVILEASFPT